MLNPIRIVLVDIINHKSRMIDALKDLEELQSLVKTYGGIDIVRIIQHRDHPDKATFIGSGKITELVDIVQKEKIQIVVINEIVSPAQLFNITQSIWPVNPDIEVWDRIDLILHIFQKHAQTKEAKLQIEIARMRHMGPRIYGLGGTLFSRQGAGIGTKGLGETNIELMKRHWRNEIKKKQDELDQLVSRRQRQLDRRRQIGLKSISIIGYTNAGKTSLFNLLTGKHKTVKNELFVTLDSVTSNIYFPKTKQHAIISDTIGFIQNLPPSLIEAFKSTLMESVNADLLLHVIDVSDDKMKLKIKVVQELLKELRVENKNQMFVFNKIDKLENLKESYNQLKVEFEKYDPQFISVKHLVGLEEFKENIEKQLF